MTEEEDVRVVRTCVGLALRSLPFSVVSLSETELREEREERTKSSILSKTAQTDTAYTRPVLPLSPKTANRPARSLHLHRSSRLADVLLLLVRGLSSWS